MRLAWLSSISARGCRVLGVAGLWLAAISSCTFPDYREVIVVERGGAGAPDNSGGAVVGGTGATGSETAGGGVGAASQGGTSQAGNTQGGTAQAGSESTSDAGAGGAPIDTGGSGGIGGADGDDQLLFDDFEDGNDDGWFATSGDWRVTDDAGSQVYQIANLKDESLFSVIGDLTWTDVAVEAKIKVLQWGGSSSSDLVGLFARFDSPSVHYYVALRADGKLAIRYKAGANVTLGTPVDAGIQLNVVYLVRFELVGSKLAVFLDGVPVLNVTDTQLTKGRIAIGADNARANFDDVTVTRL